MNNQLAILPVFLYIAYWYAWAYCAGITLRIIGYKFGKNNDGIECLQVQ